MIRFTKTIRPVGKGMHITYEWKNKDFEIEASSTGVRVKGTFDLKSGGDEEMTAILETIVKAAFHYVELIRGNHQASEGDILSSTANWLYSVEAGATLNVFPKGS